MSFWVSNRYAKIWTIFQAKDKYQDMRVSTSEKKQNDEYENSTWSARAIGKAFNQVKKGDVKEGEQYAIRGKMTNVRYKADDGTWKDNYRLLIMEFGEAGKDLDGNEPAASKSNSNPTKKAETKQKDDGNGPW